MRPPRSISRWAPGWTTPSKSHTSRVYATFDLSGFEGKTVYGGSVFIREQSAADCTKRAIEIWRTKPVGATPTWRKTPDPIAKLDEILTPEYCPGASISFEVGAAVKDAVAHKQRRITFELRVPAQFESDAAYGRRLNWYNTVQLSMQYNSAPKIDSDHLYNGGFACTQLKPPRRGWAVSPTFYRRWPPTPTRTTRTASRRSSPCGRGRIPRREASTPRSTVHPAG
nr:hypothetical protein GCM10020092_106430 [Actinoplanes digitatis]